MAGATAAGASVRKRVVVLGAGFAGINAAFGTSEAAGGRDHGGSQEPPYLSASAVPDCPGGPFAG